MVEIQLNPKLIMRRVADVTSHKFKYFIIQEQCSSMIVLCGLTKKIDENEVQYLLTNKPVFVKYN